MEHVNPDMASSRGPPGAPPSYEEVMSPAAALSDQPHAAQQILCRDFAPTWSARQSLFGSSVTGDDMAVLVSRASSWLASRNDIYLIKCETVTKIVRADTPSAGTDSALWMEPLSKKGPIGVIVRHLRLWYRKLPPSSPKPSTPPTLLIRDFVPNHGDVTLGELIQAANEWLARTKNPVVTVETVNTPLHITMYTPADQPERFITRNDSTALIFKPNKPSAFILRLFYFAHKGDGPREEMRLGLRDFIPSALGFSSPSEAMHHISSWLGQQNVHVLNIQTVKILSGRSPSACFQKRPLKYMYLPDKRSRRSYQYVTRIAYSFTPGNDTPTAAPERLSCAIFSPSKVSILPLGNGQFSMTFKNFTSVLDRLQQWMDKSAHDREVMSVETFPVQALTSEEQAGATREDVTYLHGEETWLDTIRVYLAKRTSQFLEFDNIPIASASAVNSASPQLNAAPVSGYAAVYAQNTAKVAGYSAHDVPGVSGSSGVIAGQVMVSAGPYVMAGTPAPPSPPPPSAPPTGPPTVPPTEPPTEQPTEPPTEPPTEQPTEPPTQPPTGPPTEPPTEQPTEPPTQPPTGPSTEQPTEQPTQPPTQPPTGPLTELPTELPPELPTGPSTELPTELLTETPPELPTGPSTGPAEVPTGPSTGPAELPTGPSTEHPAQSPTQPPTEATAEPSGETQPRNTVSVETHVISNIAHNITDEEGNGVASLQGEESTIETFSESSEK
ncbi:uncharacterized protein LOC106178729 [Lingula anatina]|uniref:Uncharacterized protein LOC106178729 n=1 Tax=Lingula anatina TaxID=7574 RepID=A0A1S3K4D0_LINAN|nr:uncharacterized protein LOC106178729 [Lingula anatina]|eukprot:XP_013417485.1 uncharacterized protein LOC106178729 [Lingula anatina]